MPKYDSLLLYSIPIGFPRSRIPAFWGLISGEFWAGSVFVGRFEAVNLRYKSRIEPNMKWIAGVRQAQFLKA